MKTQLTQKQYKFVEEYISNGFNGKQAALKAGYAYNTAHVDVKSIVNAPNVKEKIAQAIEKSDQKLVVTFEERVTYLRRILDDVLPKDPLEKPIRGLYKVAISAIGELNKMYGDLAPAKLLRMNVDITKNKLLEAQRVYEEY